MLAKLLLSYCGRLKMDINSLPFIERRNLFILPLNLGWFVTALANSMWQNDVIPVIKKRTGSFCPAFLEASCQAGRETTLRLSHSKKPKLHE